MKTSKTDLEQLQQFVEQYVNAMQRKVNLIDPNVLILEAGRAAGKTDRVMGPRIVRVMQSMPRELSFLVHKTYVALLTNVWPNIQAYLSSSITVGGVSRPMFQEGIDFVIGEANLPSHFTPPRYPIAYPKHSIIFRNGHHLQLVSSDQPESVAGRSGVHAFIEEMKHNKGEKLKTRLFPSLRGGPAEIRMSPYYQGITGVSDTARIDLGEDNWFEEFENNNNEQLMDEIATVACHVNRARYDLLRMDHIRHDLKDPAKAEIARLQAERLQRQVNLWQPRLDEMRRNSSYYLRVSSFVNKDILGPKFFQTQIDSMDMDEFLSSICSVRIRAVVNKFFAAYDKERHQFSDGYRYDSILKLDLREHFILTARYLKYYDPHDEILVGYDPGHFSSLVCAQEKRLGQELRVIKEFWACYPDEQPELARQFHEFFGDPVNSRIILYTDRAANKKREEVERITTDAKALQRELESYGYSVQLMSEGQSTVYHWQQFKLLMLLFSDRSNHLPHILIDENECSNLCSAIPLCPLKKTDGRIELDKTSEVKVPLQRQAGLTTQIPSAFIYLLHGLYWDKMAGELSTIPDDLPENITI